MNSQGQQGQDGFFTIARPAEAEAVRLRSRFLGACAYAADLEQVRQFVNSRRSAHPQANHHCYAYRVGAPGPLQEFASDQGEPSGSAGRPILAAIRSSNLVNVVVVVTRYFGGHKLGVRGLIEAYGDVARLCLEAAGRRLERPRARLQVELAYASYEFLLRRLSDWDARILSADFTSQVHLVLELPAALLPALQEQLRGLGAACQP